MATTRCPKCGSDQILNDECLKCGVLVSRAHVTTSTSMKPISYVAPETTGAVPEAQNVSTSGWRPAFQDRVASVTVKEKKNQLETKIFWAIVLVLAAGGFYQLYRFLVHRASAYGGYYRNDIYYFGMRLPDKGWSHFQPGDLKQKEFKDAHDAFYRGESPDNPDVTMLIWSEPLRSKVPQHFDEETSAKMLHSIEEEVQSRMTRAGLTCHITESKRRGIGTNDGFVVHAHVTKDQLSMETIIYCGFAETRAYTIQFLGGDEKMKELEPEIDKIMTSFGFDISIL
jgi:hypothetical protein